LAATFALSVVVNAGVAQNPQPAQQSKNQQNPLFNKTKRPARTVSEQEILEARELLDQLGYWVNSEIAAIGMVVIVYDSEPLAETDAAEPE